MLLITWGCLIGSQVVADHRRGAEPAAVVAGRGEQAGRAAFVGLFPDVQAIWACDAQVLVGVYRCTLWFFMNVKAYIRPEV